jgi:hypothetical protein
MTVPDDKTLYDPPYFTKRRMWRKLLEEKGVEIDCEQALDDFILRMDFLLYSKQYADAYTGFHSGEQITPEELKQLVRESEDD